MKKLVPIILILALSLSFAGCKKNKEEEQPTTLNITQPVATTNPATQASEATPEGYVLTTQAGENLGFGQTTAFDIASADEEAMPGGNMTIPDVTVPVVVTDIVPQEPPTYNPPETYPTETTTQRPTMDGNTEPSATTPTGPNEEISNDESTEPSKSDEPALEGNETTYRSDVSTANKSLSVVGTANDNSGNVIVMFDYGDWDRVKSKKANVKVSCNGKTKSLKGTVNGVNDGGQFEYTVDISEMKPSSGDYIVLSFPKGAIESLNGEVKSSECVVSYNYAS